MWRESGWGEVKGGATSSLGPFRLMGSVVPYSFGCAGILTPVREKFRVDTICAATSEKIQRNKVRRWNQQAWLSPNLIFVLVLSIGEGGRLDFIDNFVVGLKSLGNSK